MSKEIKINTGELPGKAVCKQALAAAKALKPGQWFYAASGQSQAGSYAAASYWRKKHKLEVYAGRTEDGRMFFYRI